MNDDQQPLSKASRIYFGIHHPVQYNVKVKDIGRVHPDHLVYLNANWTEELTGESEQAPEVTEEAEEAPDADHSSLQAAVETSSRSNRMFSPIFRSANLSD
jgi:hypothetical protein